MIERIEAEESPNLCAFAMTSRELTGCAVVM